MISRRVYVDVLSLRKISLMLWIFSPDFFSDAAAQHTFDHFFLLSHDQRRSSEKKFKEFSWPFSAATIEESKKRYHA